MSLLLLQDQILYSWHFDDIVCMYWYWPKYIVIVVSACTDISFWRCSLRSKQGQKIKKERKKNILSVTLDEVDNLLWKNPPHTLIRVEDMRKYGGDENKLEILTDLHIFSLPPLWIRTTGCGNCGCECLIKSNILKDDNVKGLRWLEGWSKISLHTRAIFSISLPTGSCSWTTQ
jgi:hypothetical protein